MRSDRCGCRWRPLRHDDGGDLPRPGVPDRVLVPADGVRACWSSASAARWPGGLSASRATVPFGGLAALLLYLLLRYAHDQALLRGHPAGPTRSTTSATWPSAGKTDINRYAAPIGVSPGIELLDRRRRRPGRPRGRHAGRDLRRAALAGLPLLVLYTVPTAVAPDGVSWVAFALGGIAFLTLLLAESRERVSRWGRPMRYSAAAGELAARGRDRARSARSAGGSGPPHSGSRSSYRPCCPTCTASAFGFGGGGFGRGGGGGNKVAVVNPILELGENLRRARTRPVIRYSGKPTYLRLVGAGRVHRRHLAAQRAQGVAQRQRRRGRAARAARPRPDRVARTKRSYRIEVFDLDETSGCRCPTRPSRCRHRRHLALRQRRRSTSSVRTARPADQLPGHGALGEPDAPTQLRRRVDGRAVLGAPVPRPAGRTWTRAIEGTAEQLTKGLTTNYDKALALQNWLRDPDVFTYSQTVDATVGDGNGSAARSSPSCRTGAATACSSPRRWP